MNNHNRIINYKCCAIILNHLSENNLMLFNVRFIDFHFYELNLNILSILFRLLFIDNKISKKNMDLIY